MNFLEHLDKEFALSKGAFLYSINRLPEAKVIVLNVGLSSLTYETGFFNIRSLRNFVADVSELINSDSEKRVVIVVSDSIRNMSRQYSAMEENRKSKSDLPADSRMYSALVSMVHSDIVNLFYDGFSDYNLRTIGFSVSSNGVDLVGELKRILKTIESIAYKPKDKLSDSAKLDAIKDVLHTGKNLTQTTGFKAVSLKTADTIKGLFKAYPRTIPIIMEDISQNPFLPDDDGFAAKIAAALNADVMVSISRKGMLYTTDPIGGGHALPFYCYDTSRNVPFTGARRNELSQKLNAAAAVNSHSRPIPMLLTAYNAPLTVSNLFSKEKIKAICEEGVLPTFTTFIDTQKVLRYSSDKTLPIESRLIAGSVHLNKNAAEAIINQKSSLLSVGIVRIDGKFERKSTVAIFDDNGVEIGKGVADFSSDELLDKISSGESVTVINRTRMVLARK